jgi:hypothetical protein
MLREEPTVLHVSSMAEAPVRRYHTGNLSLLKTRGVDYVEWQVFQHKLILKLEVTILRLTYYRTHCDN